MNDFSSVLKNVSGVLEDAGRHIELARLTVRRSFPKGLPLHWTSGRYAGRKCEVVDAQYIPQINEVGIRVRTYRKTPGATYKFDPNFIEDNDDFHRTYWPLNYFSEFKP